MSRSPTLGDLRGRAAVRAFARGKAGQAHLLVGDVVRKTYDNNASTRLTTEAWALERLAGSDHFPRVLAVDDAASAIYLTYVGDHVYDIGPDVIPDDYPAQLRAMVSALRSADVFHADMHLYHVTLHAGRLHLIDFEKAMTHADAAARDDLRYDDVDYVDRLVTRHFEAIRRGDTGRLPVA